MDRSLSEGAKPQMVQDNDSRLGSVAMHFFRWVLGGYEMTFSLLIRCLSSLYDI